LPNLQVLSCDQSYSDLSAEDRRGRASAIVVIEGQPDCNHVRIAASLKDGVNVAFELPRRNSQGLPVVRARHIPLSLFFSFIGKLESTNWSQAGSGDERIGQMTADAWWVKAPLPDNRYLL